MLVVLVVVFAIFAVPALVRFARSDVVTTYGTWEQARRKSDRA